MAFSPDGRQVLTASKDGTAALWEPQTGHKLRSFQGHSGEVNSAYSNPDGRLVLTCGFDCTARLWDVATGDELVRFPSLDVGSKSTPKEAPKDTDWLVITPHGLFDGSEGGRQKVNYRIGGGLNIVPVDRFFQDFYRPGLFTALWRGERPMPSVELGTARAPVVRILSPKQAGVVEQPQAELDVEAVNQGGGIKEPWLFHNGARVLDRNPAERTEKSIKRKFHVQLLPGENKLEVFSASGDGSWESEPAVLTLRYEKPLPKPNLYLVAVGVSRYAEASYKLQFARKDAKTLAELFDRRGKALYEAVHVTTLLDEDATGKRIRETMDDLAKKAQPQDTLLLFLAGHGAMVGQRYYFIPHDFKINAGAGRDDDIRKQGMPADVLADFLVKGQARRRLLILDTCASGGTVDLFQVAVRDPFALRGEVERLVHSQGLYVLAASAATEQAQEPAALGHGVLSYALLAGLRGVDKGPLERLWVQPNNPNQVVDVLEWFNFAEQHVRRLSRDQHVHMGARGSNFPVLPLGER